jgi:hypothetical protein
MKRFASVLSTVALAVTISSTTFAGTIVGARTSRTGTIVGARTGNIVGARTGYIPRARTGNISGTAMTSGLNRTRLDFGALFSENFIEIIRLLTESPLF